VRITALAFVLFPRHEAKKAKGAKAAILAALQSAIRAAAKQTQ
jgi:hypothetical protein